jgi:hypothetical protein
VRKLAVSGLECAASLNAWPLQNWLHGHSSVQARPLSSLALPLVGAFVAARADASFLAKAMLFRLGGVVKVSQPSLGQAPVRRCLQMAIMITMIIFALIVGAVACAAERSSCGIREAAGQQGTLRTIIRYHLMNK